MKCAKLGFPAKAVAAAVAPHALRAVKGAVLVQMHYRSALAGTSARSMVVMGR